MYKKVKLINHDCLPILMLLYIMLVYLTLFAALSNVVCLYNAFFLLLIFANTFCMLCLGLLTQSLFISSMIFHHAQCFNLLVFIILFSHNFLYERAMCSLEK